MKDLQYVLFELQIFVIAYLMTFLAPFLIGILDDDLTDKAEVTAFRKIAYTFDQYFFGKLGDYIRRITLREFFR